MKLYTISLAVILLVGSCHAFQQPAFVAGRSRPSTTTSCLYANSQNIRAAMEATEQYGATSPEARLAWEIVEEFDARDNDSAAFAIPRMSDERLAQANAELQASLEMIQHLTREFKYNEKHMKDVTAELQAIKLTPPEKKPAPRIPGLWDAKLKAKATSLQFGNASPEARIAWEEVEEIASAGLENAMGEDMRQTCLVEAAEACLALEELDRFLNVERMNEAGGAM